MTKHMPSFDDIEGALDGCKLDPEHVPAWPYFIRAKIAFCAGAPQTASREYWRGVMVLYNIFYGGAGVTSELNEKTPR